MQLQGPLEQLVLRDIPRLPMSGIDSDQELRVRRATDLPVATDVGR